MSTYELTSVFLHLMFYRDFLKNVFVIDDLFLNDRFALNLMHQLCLFVFLTVMRFSFPFVFLEFSL